MHNETHLMKEPSKVTPTLASSETTAQKRSEISSGQSILQSIVRMSGTQANGRAGLVVDVAVSLALLYAGMRRIDVHPLMALLTIFLGLILFSFLEYCFHRWLFHGPVHLMEQGHRRHHQEPEGYDSLPFFLPPLSMLGLAAILSMIAPVTFAFLLVGGLAAGYAAYGLSHTLIHNIRFQYSLPRRWAAAHHIHHCHPDRNFGVTTPLWDILLRTRYVSKGKRSARDIDGGPADRS